MRRVLLNLTASLDGFIADTADGVDWLAEMPAEIPEDYLRLIDTVDTLIMGRTIQPILLGDGVALWRSPHGRTQLELVHANEWPGGVVELRYRHKA